MAVINRLKYYYEEYRFVQYLVLLFLLVLSKIPVFTGKHMGFDGDEAIIGLMAQDLIDLKEFPVYFYGQHYGFSLFEVAGVAIFESFLGPSVISLKLGALLVWSIGLYAIYRTAFLLTKSHSNALLVALLIILFPGFYYWSMKARGGYVTAFALSAFVFKIVMTASELDRKNMLRLSLLNGLIFVAQPLWLLITFPLVFWRWFTNGNRKWKRIMLFTGVFTIMAILLKLPAYRNHLFWDPQIFTSDVTMTIQLWAVKLWSGISNFFFYTLDYDIPVLVTGSLIFYLILIVVTGFHMVNERRTRIYLPLTAGLIMVSIIPVFLTLHEARYFLPVSTVFMFFLVAGLSEKVPFVHDLRKKTIPVFILLPLVATMEFAGLPAHWHSPEMNDRSAIEELIDHLEENDVHYAISTDHALHYQVMYLTHRSIKAKYDGPNGRTPEDYREVSKCVLSNECKAPVIGLNGMNFGMDKLDPEWGEGLERVNERYYIRWDPSIEMLRGAGYDFKTN